MQVRESPTLSGEFCVDVAADELMCRSKRLPFAFCLGHYNPRQNRITIWRPAGSVPRGYKDAAHVTIEAALIAHKSEAGLTFAQWLTAADLPVFANDGNKPLRGAWLAGADPQAHAPRNHPGGLTLTQWCERAKLPVTSGYARRAWECGEDPLKRLPAQR